MIDDELMDQATLAEDVSSKINYEFFDNFLVKPLEPIKVKKEFSKPVEKTQAQKDANGIEAVDYDEVETEVKEVDSDYRRGVVLKVPYSYTSAVNDKEHPARLPEINVGDVILFRDRSATFFDLVKDTKLVTYYNIMAKTTK